MAAKRSYEDGCAMAHGLDLIGERWGLLVARELILGPKRFTDLRAALRGISPNVLAQRLDDLERAAIVRRRKLHPPASTTVYELTPWGLELEPAMMALGRWAARSPELMQGHAIGTDAFILSLRTMFNARSSPDLEGTIELRLGDDRFIAIVAGGELHLTRGIAEKPDAIIDSTSNELAGVIYGGLKLAEAMREGQVRIEGDKALVRRFVTMFPLPDPAPPAQAYS